MFENSTIQMTTTLIESIPPVKYSLINIDIKYKYPPLEPKPYQIFFTDDDDFKRHDHELIFKDPEALIVQTFDEHHQAAKLLFSRQRFPLSERCSTFIVPVVVVNPSVAHYVDDLMQSVIQLKLVNIALVVWWLPSSPPNVKIL